MTIFIDTSAIMGIINANDSNHLPAKEAWGEFINRGVQFITNNYVLIETYALLQNRFGMEAVKLFRRDIAPIIEKNWVTEEIHEHAISAMLAANRRRLSLVDCTSFETMRRLGIRQVFAFDTHFTEQGFEVLPAVEKSQE